MNGSVKWFYIIIIIFRKTQFSFNAVKLWIQNVKLELPFLLPLFLRFIFLFITTYHEQCAARISVSSV